MRLRSSVPAGILLVGALLGATVLLAPPAFAAPATATFARTASWTTGYEAKYTITNGTTATITGWRVEFDLPAGTTVSSMWDAVRGGSGQHVIASNAGWNGTLAPGASASFGFVAGGTGNPTNCTLNGASCSGTGGPTTPPPPGVPGAPGSLRITGTTSSSIALAWNASSGTVTGYRVYEGTAVRATVTGLSATIGGLGAGTTHTYVVRAYNNAGESANSNSVTGTTTGGTTPPPAPAGQAAAPYYYQWGSPPAPSTVMSATGVRWFTLAFVLSGGGCTPAWDGNRPLTGGADQATINAIRAAGGDVIPSFGGWSGNKLGPNCSSASALAGAYQQVINAYNLRAIDIDIENIDEFESEAVQDRILGALRIIKQNNPNVRTIVTIPTTTSGPNFWGTRLINQAAALQANIDVFTIMPFNFGGGANMFQSTVNASEGLKTALRNAFGWSDAVAYSRMGISGMNGLSDQQELTSPATWQQIRDWARARNLARFTFWSVNRDRPCPGGGVVANCSGISQTNWQFTQITATYAS